MEEMQKILEQVMGQDSEDNGQDEEDSSDNWAEVPFSGHITITKNLQGRATMKQEGDTPRRAGSLPGR